MPKDLNWYNYIWIYRKIEKKTDLNDGYYIRHDRKTELKKNRMKKDRHVNILMNWMDIFECLDRHNKKIDR